MSKFSFYFDLNSISWAVLSDDDIIASGKREFKPGETLDGKSLGAERREKRLQRRNIKRKVQRRNAIKKLLLKYGFFDDIEAFDKYLHYANKEKDLWQLRVEALYREVSKEELARILIYFASHRGFLSKRKSAEERDKDKGKVLTAIRNNKTLTENNDKALVEFIYERAGVSGKKKNYSRINEKDEVEQVYDNTISRLEIVKELNKLYAIQPLFTESLYHDYLDILFWDKPMQSVYRMVKYCTFEPSYKRCCANSISFELYKLHNLANNLRYIVNGEEYALTAEQKQQLFELAYKTKTLKYKSLHKLFKKDTTLFSTEKQPEIHFKGLDYRNEKAEDKEFFSFVGFHSFVKRFGKEFVLEHINDFDRVINIIAYQKTDAMIEAKIKSDVPIFTDEDVEFFKTLNFSGFSHLSLVALYKILPYLKKGYLLHQACEAAGYKHNEENFYIIGDTIYLEKIPEDVLLPPTVKKVLTQLRKVYNELVDAYGTPSAIHYNIAKDLKYSYQKRREIFRENLKNEAYNKKAVETLTKLGLEPTKYNIEKYKLWNSQERCCLYTGTPISLNELFTDKIQVDHIIPYSRCCDNSYANKMITTSAQNALKGNKIPYEYFAANSQKWQEFVDRVKYMKYLSPGKKERLLSTDFADNESQCIENNLNDNHYIAKFLKKYFSYGAEKDCNCEILGINDSVIDLLRDVWKVRYKILGDEKNKSGIVSAVIAGYVDKKLIRKLTKLSQMNNDELPGNTFVYWPYNDFWNKLQEALKHSSYSFAVEKNITGELHKEKVYTLNPNHKNYDEKNTFSGIKVRGGICSNADMLRIDLFEKNGKFYAIPIYKHNINRELFNKFITCNKKEQDWAVLDDTYVFKFSLFINEHISVTSKTGEVFHGIYKGIDRTSGAIKILDPWTKESIRISIGKLTGFSKYQVSVLGNLHKVNNETRLDVFVKPKSRKNK